MHSKYPKILPWLAKQSGITQERAEALWNAALLHAAREPQANESPAFWKLAVDRLLELMAEESRKNRAMPFGFGPMVRLPAQLWLHGLTAQQALLRAAANSARWWQRRPC